MPRQMKTRKPKKHVLEVSPEVYSLIDEEAENMREELGYISRSKIAERIIREHYAREKRKK
jgi:hypothetical protein